MELFRRLKKVIERSFDRRLRNFRRMKKMAERSFDRRLKNWLVRNLPASQTSTPGFLQRPALEVLGKLIRGFVATVEILTALQERIVQLNQELDEKNAELAELNSQLKTQATTDALTKLNNREGMKRDFMHAVNLLAHNGSKPYCVFLMDLDNFKAVNDTRGHEEGDKLLVYWGTSHAQVYPPSKR